MCLAIAYGLDPDLPLPSSARIASLII
uniref:Uncharacterized protein n=1 Tax=Arundo donax TaxID=35708 RepID=A0A0A9E0H7_ARUDO